MRGVRDVARTVKYSGELSIRLDRFILEGKSVAKEIVQHKDSVAILPLVENRSVGSRNNSDSVILVTQYRRAADAVLLEIPAGKLETGETPLRAARRELGEEIGYRAKSLKPLVKCYLAPGYDTEFMTIFLARGLERIERGKLDDDENIRVKKMSLSLAIQKCLSGQIRDCKSIAALSTYAMISGYSQSL